MLVMLSAKGHRSEMGHFWRCSGCNLRRFVKGRRFRAWLITDGPAGFGVQTSIGTLAGLLVNPSMRREIIDPVELRAYTEGGW